MPKNLKMLRISGGIVDGKGLIASLRDGLPLVESELYHEIFKFLQDLHIELNVFPSIPMRLCFPGPEKLLINQTKNLNSRKNMQGNFWKQLIQPMQKSRRC